MDHVTLEIRSGEFVAVVGASGSGKSTLLSLLAGLDTPTSGSIVVDDTNLSDLSRRQRAHYRAHKVGMIFQSFNLLPHQTALKNVELALYFNDVPRHDRQRRAEAILQRLGLGDRLDHRPVDLSGGEQQRVAIARALVKQPRILFADEPTGNLDHDNARLIEETLTQLHRDGLTVVMVTHDLDLAARTAERALRMHYGGLVLNNPIPDTGGEEA